jgi:hypothetical protein
MLYQRVSMCLKALIGHINFGQGRFSRLFAVSYYLLCLFYRTLTLFPLTLSVVVDNAAGHRCRVHFCLAWPLLSNTHAYSFPAPGLTMPYQLLSTTPPGAVAVFTCQRGERRSTIAMVLGTLIRMHQVSVFVCYYLSVLACIVCATQFNCYGVRHSHSHAPGECVCVYYYLSLSLSFASTR